MLAFLQSNPWRTPDWCWRRITHILDGGPRTTSRRDTPAGYKWITRGKDFLEGWRACPSHDNPETANFTLLMDYPDIFWAYWIWSQHQLPARWAIEAHLLARETDREIGFRSGCDPDIIAAYEALFFNVRPKLNYREYVSNVVLGEAITRGLNERPYDLLWKLFGFCGGPHVLDAMIGHLVNPIWAHRAEQVPTFFQDAALNLMKKKAAISALTVPINASTNLHLIESFVKYVEIERTTETSGKAQDQILMNINAMLAILPFAVGTADNAIEIDSPTKDYDESNVELNGGELLLVAAGRELPNREELLNLRFPDPVIPSKP